MKKSLVLFLMSVLICASSLTVFAASEFSDVNGHWAESSIERVTGEGIANGYGEDFKPDNNISRVECAVMIARMIGCTEEADLSAYHDVDKDAWYYSELSKAVAAGIIKGDGNGLLRPNDNVKRQEAMVMLDRVFKLSNSEEGTLNFADSESVSDYAKSAIMAFVKNLYVNGYTDNTIKPLDPITRAELSKIIDKSVGKIIREAGEYDLSDVEGNVIVRAENVELKNYKGNGNIVAINSDVEKSLELDKVSEEKVVSLTEDSSKEEVKDDEKEESKPSSSGGGGGGGSSTPVAATTLTITTDGEAYTITKSDAIANGKPLTVVVDGAKVLDRYSVKEGNFKANVTVVVNKLNADAIVKTLSTKYNDNKNLRTWGLAIAEAMTDEQKLVAMAAAIQGNGDVALVSDVYNALLDANVITADDLKTLAIDTLFTTFTYSEIIDILNQF